MVITITAALERDCCFSISDTMNQVNDKLISWLINWSRTNDLISLEEGACEEEDLTQPRIEAEARVCHIKLDYIYHREIWLLNLGNKLNNDQRITFQQYKAYREAYHASIGLADENIKQAFKSYIYFSLRAPEESENQITWEFSANEGADYLGKNGKIQDSIGGGYEGEILYIKAKKSFEFNIDKLIQTWMT
ncbi:MAG: hypothetical protein FJZ16_00600 [Candidatus Omnitrophica bacterium]|nr:hypothetical protein [Candidatus Omnitrophota bacterium]